MREIKVSIMTITFNHAKFIRQTLDGFLSQKTNFDYEIIIHDDASTDETQDIIREYMKQYPDKIRAVLQTENQFSKGADVYSIIQPMARGNYIATCEGDDYWCDDTKLQRQADILDAHPDYIACVHQTECLNCNTGEKRPQSRVDSDRLITFDDVIIGGNQAYQMSSLMLRKEFFCMKEKPDFLTVSVTNGDFPNALFLVLNGGVYFINRTMSVYRLFSSGTAWTAKVHNIEQIRRHTKEMTKMLKMVDTYSRYKYHLKIHERILKFEYQLAKIDDPKAAVSKYKYRKFLKSESFKDKCKLYVKAYAPAGLVESFRKNK